MMESVNSSETYVNFYEATLCNIPEGCNFRAGFNVSSNKNPTYIVIFLRIRTGKNSTCHLKRLFSTGHVSFHRTALIFK